MMYAYFGVGAVRIPETSPTKIGPLSYTYCFMVGNMGTMCGYAMQRMMNGMMTTPPA